MYDKDALTKQFAEEVNSKSIQIDPNDEEDWGSLTLGYALGKGLSPADAQDFSSYIRWDTDLG